LKKQKKVVQKKCYETIQSLMAQTPCLEMDSQHWETTMKAAVDSVQLLTLSDESGAGCAW
jgi:CDP-diacylglycerol pyrophosphatase